jgi:phosphomannomutase
VGASEGLSATALLTTAAAWLSQDPDETTRAELGALIAAVKSGDSAHAATAHAELADRFGQRLEFGTAGLRGELGAGSNRMNRVLVSQAAAGFANFLLERHAAAVAAGVVAVGAPAGAPSAAATSATAGTTAAAAARPSVVIGYDGRVNSEIFACDTAEIMAGVGVRAILLPRMLPTPVLAFAVRHLDASAGVMVTASHNPARDNGYKVYLGGADHGSQIVSPVDAEIAAQIDRVAAEANVLELPRSDAFETADDSVLDEYVRRTAAIASPVTSESSVASGRSIASESNVTSSPALSIVYTAMHGVGWETAQRVFSKAGFAAPTVVTEQIAPDASFPTVAFPNPEEPGAMDLAIARAITINADVVIANDPDADRLAVAVPGADGAWRRLSGNEVGYLLGWRAANRIVARDVAAVAASPSIGARTLAASIVSSPALGHIAAHHGLPFVDTLTGFKWVSRVDDLAYGYEEALGYLVDPEKVRDKDGISAAVEFLSLMTELKAHGISLDQHILTFADTFGAFASSQISLRVDDLADIPRIMNSLRQNPPELIGPCSVARIDDFANGFDMFPPGEILRLWLTHGARVIVRPSGTEPKLKVYIDACSTEGTATERIAHAEALVADIDQAMRMLLAA